MPEYIEREPLLVEYDREHEGPPGRARELIVNAPAVDVAPVRHGRWEQKEVFEAKDCVDELQSAFCPVCQRYHTTPYSYYFSHYNYCPHCGAKMEESE